MGVTCGFHFLLFRPVISVIWGRLWARVVRGDGDEIKLKILSRDLNFAMTKGRNGGGLAIEEV